MSLIIPKNNAESATMDATMQVYYDASDWVTNEDLIERLSAILIQKNIEKTKKEPQSYTKKTQVPAYFGFIEWENPEDNQSRRRLTESGRNFYEARRDGDQKSVIRILINALLTCTFGRNVVGCTSDSDIEAPNVFIKASLLLGKLSYTEFAYILGLMEYGNLEFGDAVYKLKMLKKKGLSVELDSNSKKWSDPKPIIALKNWGLLDDEGCLNDDVVKEYYQQLSELRARNTEPVKFIPVADSPEDKDNSEDEPLQQIYYGAPGTGKSRAIYDKTDGKYVIRTTFHPDSDYSTFVGVYKPSINKDGCNVDGHILDGNQNTARDTITYKFVGQSFFNAYIKAWMNKLEGSNKSVYLIIEEINRGNCAQIFGDLFQLLDRNENGYSSYPIVPDEDLGTEIGIKLREMSCSSDLETIIVKDCSYKNIINGDKLLLPNNLYIWATMNTSDQNLFPIDSAFKRRWEWVYTPIEIPKEPKYANREIIVGDDHFNWGNFIMAINKRIYNATNSEDKQLGFFFCQPTKNENYIDDKTFVGKVVFYLWQDVFRMSSSAKSVFNFDGKMHPFPEFYSGSEINSDLVKEFIKSIMREDKN